MKISQLILRLQTFKASLGDVDVTYRDMESYLSYKDGHNTPGAFAVENTAIRVALDKTRYVELW